MNNLFGEQAVIEPGPGGGLGGAMAGGAGKGVSRGAKDRGRQPFDFYPTPPEPVRALLAVEGDAIANGHGRRIWEPCGHGGGIASILGAAGFEVIATDIRPDSDNGVAMLDLLTAKRRRAEIVVTNPPFSLAAEIIEQLIGALAVPYVALLLKSTYWHAMTARGALWARFRPTACYPIGWRVDFLGLGAPAMDVSWFVWDRRRASAHCSYQPLARPKAAGGLV